MKTIKKLAFGGVMLFILLFIAPFNVFAGSTSMVAKVWAGVPLIGHIYVCTPHTVYWDSVQNESGKFVKEITKVTTKDSYTSAGIAIVSYSHYDSWAELSVVNPALYRIYASGHCDFVFKGCPVSMGLQTFLYKGSIE